MLLSVDCSNRNGSSSGLQKSDGTNMAMAKCAKDAATEPIPVAPFDTLDPMAFCESLSRCVIPKYHPNPSLQVDIPQQDPRLH